MENADGDDVHAVQNHPLHLKDDRFPLGRVDRLPLSLEQGVELGYLEPMGPEVQVRSEEAQASARIEARREGEELDGLEVAAEAKLGGGAGVFGVHDDINAQGFF